VFNINYASGLVVFGCLVGLSIHFDQFSCRWQNKVDNKSGRVRGGQQKDTRRVERINITVFLEYF